MMSMEHLTPDDLAAFLDGELPDDARASAASHIAGCDSCGAELSGQSAVKDALRALPRPVPTEADRASWMAAVSSALTPGRVVLLRHKKTWAAGLSAAAALALVAGVGIAVVRRSPTSAPAAGVSTVHTTRTSAFVAPPPGSILEECPPVAAGEPLILITAEDIAQAMSTLRDTCATAFTREGVGRYRRIYSDQLSAVQGADACLVSLYDQTDAPLLPVYAAPALYQNEPAFVVVFLTTFTSPASASDRLDERQAWVLRRESCGILNVVTG